MEAVVNNQEFQILRTDAVIAAEIKAELDPLLKQCCALIEKAKANGMRLDFGFAVDSFGRSVPANVSVVKPL